MEKKEYTHAKNENTTNVKNIGEKKTVPPTRYKKKYCIQKVCDEDTSIFGEMYVQLSVKCRFNRM